MISIKEYTVSMSDGVRLYTRLVLPGDGTGRYPTVFMRTPYDKETTVTEATVRYYENDSLLQHGYAIVYQHCRGRGGSEGVCVPYDTCERSDGLETIEWIRTLPHYNGELFLSGGSYTASILLMILNADIPDLKAVALSVQTESMYHRNYFNGMCRSYCGFEWWLSMIEPQQPRIAEWKDIYLRPYCDIMKRATGKELSAFTDGLLHDRYDDFWKNDPRIGVMETLRVPVLMVSGWFDYYCYGMCSMWNKLSPETRKKSCFLMTPCGHDLGVRKDSCYPFLNASLPADREAEWFDSVRNGTEYPYAELGKFRYYSIGENRWYTANEPYEIKPSLPLYFSADRRLKRAEPICGPLTYEYDPEHLKHHDKHDYMFLCDYERLTEDGVTFFSDPFEKDASFFGPISFEMTLNSDCGDTAFFMRLYLVEDGKCYNLTDAITTLLHADPEFKAGKLCRVRILSQPTAFRVKKGNSLRVDISSCSDCYVPHSNTREALALAKTVKIAHNTVICGQSTLKLPLKK